MNYEFLSGLCLVLAILSLLFLFVSVGPMLVRGGPEIMGVVLVWLFVTVGLFLGCIGFMYVNDHLKPTATDMSSVADSALSH